MAEGLLHGVKDRNNPDHMLVKSHAPFHGDTDQIHATRGEMFGVLACIQHIQYIVKKFKYKT